MVSLLALSWSMVSDEQANRWANPEKPKLSPLGSLYYFLWRFFVVASRVVTLAIFATAFTTELFILWGLHWLLMAMWIGMMVRVNCSLYMFL